MSNPDTYRDVFDKQEERIIGLVLLGVGLLLGFMFGFSIATLLFHVT